MQAIVHYIRYSCPFLKILSENSLKNLINNSTIISIIYNDSMQTNRSPYSDISNNGLMVYKNGEKTDYMTIVLDGTLQIHSGIQDFSSEVSRWYILCSNVLENACNAFTNKQQVTNNFIPDFSARVLTDSRLLRIPCNSLIKELINLKVVDNIDSVNIEI